MRRDSSGLECGFERGPLLSDCPFGDRRVDSFHNILANDRVSLLFLVPGMNETLRVNGRAKLTTDPNAIDDGHAAAPGRRVGTCGWV